MKVLVTGAAGQLGYDLVKVLSDSGYEVIQSDIDDFDITNFEETKNFISEVKPESIVHSAAFTDVDACESHQEKAFAINSLGPRNVAIAARKVNAKLFYISTDYVFDGFKEGPFFEFDSPNPLNVYGRSKLWGEVFVKEQLNKFFIIRIAWLYGRVGNNFVKTMLRLASSQKELRIVNDQRGTPTYSRDIALQIKELLDTELYGTYHCTSQGYCTWYEFAVEIFRLAGLNVNVRPITTEEFPRPAKRPKNSVLENFALKIEGIDIMPHWQESLEEFITLFKKGEILL